MKWDSPQDYIEWATLLHQARDHPSNTLSFTMLKDKSRGWLRAYIERLEMEAAAERRKP